MRDRDERADGQLFHSCCQTWTVAKRLAGREAEAFLLASGVFVGEQGRCALRSPSKVGYERPDGQYGLVLCITGM
jgi:hypothetical protein